MDSIPGFKHHTFYEEWAFYYQNQICGCLFENYTYFTFGVRFSHLFSKGLVSHKIVEEIIPEVHTDEKLL